MSNDVRLRNIEPNDLPIFYEQQLDADATRMAAFPARDRAAFDAHWATKILGNPAAVNQTILLDGQVAGNIGSWPQDGVRLVGYWIGKEHWGKGVATRALAAFLHLVTERPLHAHVAKHNVGSIRVLEKCGFSLEREESVEDARKDVRRARARPALRPLPAGGSPLAEEDQTPSRLIRRRRYGLKRSGQTCLLGHLGLASQALP